MSNSTAQTSSYLPLLLTYKLQLGFDVFAIAFGGLGNGLVLTVVLNKKQRNIHDIFVANLAMADILFILFSIPGDVFKVINKSPNSLVYCSTIRPFITMFFCLGLFTITLMALYRCYVIVNPYKPKMKFCYVYFCVFAVWLMSFVTVLPVIIVATVSTSGFCTGTWSLRAYKDAYIIFLLLVKCVVPLFLITVSYIRVGVFLIYHKPPAVTSSTSARRDGLENMKIIRTVALIVLLFALCTTPYQVGWAMIQFGDKLLRKKAGLIMQLTPLIQNLHTCVNPVIYAISRRYFRQEYVKYFRKICCIWYCVKDMRINPTTSDDYTQQPHHLTHAHDDNNMNTFGVGENLEETVKLPSIALHQAISPK